MTGTGTRDMRGRTRHGIAGAILAMLMLTGQAGAQVDRCDWTEGAFWDGAGLPAVERCIDAGADIEARTEHGSTPLHNAVVLYGKAEIVQALITAGADIEARTEDGRTPLHRAARNSIGAEAVQALIAAGADIGVRSNNGDTPLHEAAHGGTAESVQALIDARADIRAQTEDGRLAADLAEGNAAVRNHPVFWTLNDARFD
ncbi:MAG: ankyrin repeat domain-containing protein [Rhodospirillales bacterium]|nr:ankyrin repeat domain-containing protein [Rhodospirillales bacterium]